MNNENVDLITALDYIEPSALSYSEWLAVGMDLYANGYDVSVWDNWSRSDSRYKPGICATKWRTFTDNITPGTVIGMAIKNGFRTSQVNKRVNVKRRVFEDPKIEIEPFEENVTTWNLNDQILKAHERLLENNSADVVKYVYPGDNKTYEITALQYLTRVRKIPIEFIKRKRIGYAVNGHNQILDNYPEYKSFESKNTQLHKIVLPYVNADGINHYYLTETIDRNAQIYCGNDNDGKPLYRTPEKYKKPNKDNETKVTLNDGTTEIKPATVPQIKAEIYNEHILKTANVPKVVFVVEGIYDALSVEIAGGNAIAFVGTGHKRFLSICKRFMPQCLFVVALDNDTSGNKAIKRVTDGLTELGLKYITKQAPEPYKDFNECLQHEPELLKKFVTEINSLSDVDNWNERFKTAIKTPPKSKNALSVFNRHYNAQNKRYKRPN